MASSPPVHVRAGRRSGLDRARHSRELYGEGLELVKSVSARIKLLLWEIAKLYFQVATSMELTKRLIDGDIRIDGAAVNTATTLAALGVSGCRGVPTSSLMAGIRQFLAVLGLNAG